MELHERRKVIATVIVLTLQLREWLTFARETGTVRGRAKQLSGILLSAVNNTIKFFFEGHDSEGEQAYEHSVKISDVVTELLTLDDEQQRRVLGLIKKMKAGN